MKTCFLFFCEYRCRKPKWITSLLSPLRALMLSYMSMVKITEFLFFFVRPFALSFWTHAEATPFVERKHDSRVKATPFLFARPFTSIATSSPNFSEICERAPSCNQNINIKDLDQGLQRNNHRISKGIDSSLCKVLIRHLTVHAKDMKNLITYTSRSLMLPPFSFSLQELNKMIIFTLYNNCCLSFSR